MQLIFRYTCIPIREIIVLYHHILGTQEAETGLILVECWEVFILYNGIATESQSVDALGKNNRTVKCFEVIVFYYYTRMTLSTMEILLLVVQVLDFRIDGNDGFRKLEEIGQ